MCAVLKMRRIVLFFALIFAAAAAWAIGGLAQEEVRLPILMYHSVLKDEARSGKYIVTPAQVEKDMEYLEELGYKCVSAKNVIDHVLDNEPLPEKPYMITFDDGNYNNLTYILPLLEKHDAYAVISVVGSYSERDSESGETNPAYSYLKWQDIRQLAESGRVEIGNHSYNMHSIKCGRIGSARARGEDSGIYCGKFSEDCDKTQKLLLNNCGIEPIIYTYPYGAYCDESREILHKKGFVMTLTCNEGINTLTNDPECLYLMRRFNRPAGADSADFMKKCGIK